MRGLADFWPSAMAHSRRYAAADTRDVLGCEPRKAASPKWVELPDLTPTPTTKDRP